MRRSTVYIIHINFQCIEGRIFWGCNTVAGISRAGTNYMLWLSDGNKVIVRSSDSLLIAPPGA